MLAPAMLRGGDNGALGVFTLLIVDGSTLVALPVGLPLAVAMAIVALIRLAAPRPHAPGRPAVTRTRR